MAAVRTTGRCLCGAVRFELYGPLREVLVCHCVECRRWHGHISASTAVQEPNLMILSDASLRWIDSPHSDAHARRGFCAECGSSLFWAPAGSDIISVSAGTLDEPNGLRVAAHWFTDQVGDYYELPDDNLPRYRRSGERS